MNVHCLLLFYIINFANAANNEDEIDYYVRLIEEEIQRSSTFEGPNDASEYRPRRGGSSAIGTWDYIVIGAGAAGSVIANRLSDYDNSVLLLEAGEQETNFTDIPAMVNYAIQSEFNWNYRTTSQTSCCLGMINRQCNIPIGKGLGGSTIINALKYARGNRRDFDNWPFGDYGWNYNDSLPLFKRSENVQFCADLNYHGTSGELYIEYEKPVHPQTLAFMESSVHYGKNLVDYNAAHQLGVSLVQFNTIKGRRQSNGKAFLTPILKRKNLTILTKSYVTKILIDESKVTYGVQFSYQGATFTAFIREEVILSAGTIGSPHLLMLSGIGPSVHLREVGIQVIQYLPVGNHLQDHPFMTLSFSTNYSEPIRSLRHNVERYLDDSGPFTYAFNSQGISFLQSKYNHIAGYPDIELIMNPSNLTAGNVQQVYNYRDEVYEALWNRVSPRNSFSFYVVFLHERSEGTIRLKSNDPFDYPAIDINFFSDRNNEDLEFLYQGIELVLNLTKAPSFREMETTLIRSVLPACRHLRYLSREFWYCQIKQVATSFNHPIGTCRMGPNRYQDVVDHELRVYGIRNLRVADASIIPVTPSGHVSSLATLIAEKLAEMILNKDTNYY